MGKNGMITCREVATLLSSGGNEHLSFSGRWRLRFHRWMCRHCTKFSTQMDQIHDAGLVLRSSHEAEKAARDDASGFEARLLEKLKRGDGSES